MSGYKTECPQCGGLNYYYTSHNDFGYCFSPTCGYYSRAANTQTEKKRSNKRDDIRQYYTKLTNYYHSCLSKEHRQFLYSRGYTDELIERKLIGYCPPGTSHLYRDDIAKEAGLVTANSEGFLKERIIFPYICTFNPLRITDLRGRKTQGNGIKYLSPYGGDYKRWSDYPYNYYLHTSKRIIITEAEIKSDIGLLHGYSIVGLPGMTQWKSGFIPRDNQEIVVCFDNQREYRNVIEAIKRLNKHLCEFKVATLPLFGEQKAEIDTFIPKYGKDLFDNIIQNALPFNKWLALQR
jgi:hypothetical protein